MKYIDDRVECFFAFFDDKIMKDASTKIIVKRYIENMLNVNNLIPFTEFQVKNDINLIIAHRMEHYKNKGEKVTRINMKASTTILLAAIKNLNYPYYCPELKL